MIALVTCNFDVVPQALNFEIVSDIGISDLCCMFQD